MKRASNAPPEEYDHTKFITLQASRRYTTLAKNKDFIKEKGFESSNDFFREGHYGKGMARPLQASQTSYKGGGEGVLFQFK